MSSQYRSIYPQFPVHGTSPSVSAVRSSPLSSLPSYPLTASSFPSSPSLSSLSSAEVGSLPSTPTPAQRGSQPSPDFFQDFEYTQEMDDRVQMIESADFHRRRNNLPPLSLHDGVPVGSDTPLLPQDRAEKAWVVFQGKNPGVYPYSVMAAMQTVGQKDGFQRAYPDQASAEAAFNLFKNERIYPDYGKAPWVVFLGGKVGVITKITELESSVKGFSGALFRSCSSTSEGKIKFELFSQKVAMMFANSADPFSAVDELMPQQGGDIFTDPAASIPTPTRQPIAGSSTHQSPQSVGKINFGAPSSVSSSRRAMKAASRIHGQGWFVAFNAVLPGVYYGVEALKTANPQPGGYRCVTDEESAHEIFHEYMQNDRLVFVPSME